MISPQIKIGPFTFHLYGLLIAISVYLGWLVAKKRARAYGIPQKIFDEPILIIPLILSVIGARLYHVMDFWEFYSRNPGLILNITNGGLGIWGALVGMFIGFAYVAKIKRFNLLSILDLAAPSILLGQALGRIGNFINLEGFGPPTKYPWGIYIPQSKRPANYLNSDYFHPTFFYEAILDVIFFIVLIIVAKKLKIKGQVFSLYLIFYAVSRFIAEFFRIDTWIIGSIKVAHILSVIAFIFGLTFFFYLLKLQKRKNLN